MASFGPAGVGQIQVQRPAGGAYRQVALPRAPIPRAAFEGSRNPAELRPSGGANRNPFIGQTSNITPGGSGGSLSSVDIDRPGGGAGRQGPGSGGNGGNGGNPLPSGGGEGSLSLGGMVPWAFLYAGLIAAAFVVNEKFFKKPAPAKSCCSDRMKGAAAPA